ncbi:ABC-three component system middle component 2 [Hymenobacter sp. BT559]|uniref:ABC-three component system middle component 2 n=1 Tax=Hymenobacter sp. BT559 TaxID=2795729 RepID=UPI00351C64C4
MVDEAKLERPFNHPVEVGIRLLYILNVFHPRSFDIKHLLYMDYLLVHSADAGGPSSLHAAMPYRTGEWLVRRKILEAGLALMFSKELLSKHLSNDGITFSASPLTKHFLKHLKSEYALGLYTRAEWLKLKFDNMNSNQINEFMKLNLTSWGNEFKAIQY